MIRPDLSGCTVASFTAGGGTHVADVRSGGVVCAAARKMLSLGVDPTEEIDVRRDSRPVFLRYFIRHWRAERTIPGGVELAPRAWPLRPTERPYSAKSAFQVPRCPPGETPVYGPSVRVATP